MRHAILCKIARWLRIRRPFGRACRPCCRSAVFPFFFPTSFPFSWPPTPSPLLAPGSASANSPRAPAGLPWDEFNQLFDDSKRHRKITDFSNPQKTYKVIESTAFLTSKEGFRCKNHDFWVPFCYRFLPVLGKWQKCVISEEYNAKRVSEPSKNSKNRIDFSLNLHAFLKPLPKTILEVSKCQSMLKS